MDPKADEGCDGCPKALDCPLPNADVEPKADGCDVLPKAEGAPKALLVDGWESWPKAEVG